MTNNLLLVASLIASQGNNQAVSNCLYGLAKLDFKGVKLVEKIERVKIGRRMVDRRGRGVQNLGKGWSGGEEQSYESKVVGYVRRQ